jgi:hypothetical protein
VKLEEFFLPARLSPTIALSETVTLDMGYVGECCRICGLIVHADQRAGHVEQHVAAGALKEAVGTGEPEWFIRDYGSGSPWIPTIHDRHWTTAPTTNTTLYRVHVLHHGLALCGFSDKVPREWPDEQWWVGLADCSHATCTPCVEAIASLFRETGL